MKRMLFCVLVLLVCVGGCAPSQSELRGKAISEFQVGHLEQARTIFTGLIDHDPSDSVSYYYLGRIYHTEGKYAHAMYYYQSCLTTDPSNSDARRDLDQAQKDAGSAGETMRYVP